MNKAVLWIVVLVIVIGGIWWMMSGSSSPAVAPVTETPPVADTTTPAASTLVSGEQKAGKEVVISSVTLGQDASIVIHKDVNGSAADVIGSVTLKAGSYTGVKIALSEAVKSGDTIYSMIHPDTDSDGKYEADTEEGTPLKDAAGALLIETIKVK